MGEMSCRRAPHLCNGTKKYTLSQEEMEAICRELSCSPEAVPTAEVCRLFFEGLSVFVMEETTTTTEHITVSHVKEKNIALNLSFYWFFSLVFVLLAFRIFFEPPVKWRGFFSLSCLVLKQISLKSITSMANNVNPLDLKKIEATLFSTNANQCGEANNELKKIIALPTSSPILNSISEKDLRQVFFLACRFELKKGCNDKIRHLLRLAKLRFKNDKYVEFIYNFEQRLEPSDDYRKKLQHFLEDPEKNIVLKAKEKNAVIIDQATADRNTFIDKMINSSNLFKAEQYHKCWESFHDTLEFLKRSTIKAEPNTEDCAKFLMALAYTHIGNLTSLKDALEIYKTLIGARSLREEKDITNASKAEKIPMALLGLALSLEKFYRFKLAQIVVKRGLQILSNKKKKAISYTWPGTQEELIYADPTYLKEEFETLEKNFQFPPKVTATCKYSNCLENQIIPSNDIYKEEPEFNGYVEIKCEDGCVISYHISCWKCYKEKVTGNLKFSDQEMLSKNCPTDDCYRNFRGAKVFNKIIELSIYDKAGEIKTNKKIELPDPEPAPMPAPPPPQPKKKAKKPRQPVADQGAAAGPVTPRANAATTAKGSPAKANRGNAWITKTATNEPDEATKTLDIVRLKLPALRAKLGSLPTCYASGCLESPEPKKSLWIMHAVDWVTNQNGVMSKNDLYDKFNNDPNASSDFRNSFFAEERKGQVSRTEFFGHLLLSGYFGCVDKNIFLLKNSAEAYMKTCEDYQQCYKALFGVDFVQSEAPANVQPIRQQLFKKPPNMNKTVPDLRSISHSAIPTPTLPAPQATYTPVLLKKLATDYNSVRSRAEIVAAQCVNKETQIISALPGQPASEELGVHEVPSSTNIPEAKSKIAKVVPLREPTPEQPPVVDFVKELSTKVVVEAKSTTVMDNTIKEPSSVVKSIKEPPKPVNEIPPLKPLTTEPSAPSNQLAASASYFKEEFITNHNAEVFDPNLSEKIQHAAKVNGLGSNVKAGSEDKDMKTELKAESEKLAAALKLIQLLEAKLSNETDKCQKFENELVMFRQERHGNTIFIENLRKEFREKEKGYLDQIDGLNVDKVKELSKYEDMTKKHEELKKEIADLKKKLDKQDTSKVKKKKQDEILSCAMLRNIHLLENHWQFISNLYRKEISEKEDLVCGLFDDLDSESILTYEAAAKYLQDLETARDILLNSGKMMMDRLGAVREVVNNPEQHWPNLSKIDVPQPPEMPKCVVTEAAKIYIKKFAELTKTPSQIAQVSSAPVQTMRLPTPPPQLPASNYTPAFQFQPPVEHPTRTNPLQQSFQAREYPEEGACALPAPSRSLLPPHLASKKIVPEVVNLPDRIETPPSSYHSYIRDTTSPESSNSSSSGGDPMFVPVQARHIANPEVPAARPVLSSQRSLLPANVRQHVDNLRSPRPQVMADKFKRQEAPTIHPIPATKVHPSELRLDGAFSSFKEGELKMLELRHLLPCASQSDLQQALHWLIIRKGNKLLTFEPVELKTEMCNILTELLLTADKRDMEYSELEKIKLTEIPAEECSICITRFREDFKPIHMLPCDHIFHKTCIRNWLETAGDSSGNTNRGCPNCRASVETAAPSTDFPPLGASRR